MNDLINLRRCFREPIPEIMEAAHHLDAAASAYQSGRLEIAENYIVLADMPLIREWTESIWGKNSPYLELKTNLTSNNVAPDRVKARMPSASEKKALHVRDGYHCRFCGIPVIRREVRGKLQKAFPTALRWGTNNQAQHAAFQAMWAQYDHIVPHAMGGTNELENLVVTCAPCNFGRMSYTLAQVGIMDPRQYPPKTSPWDGLERIL